MIYYNSRLGRRDREAAPGPGAGARQGNVTELYCRISSYTNGFPGIACVAFGRGPSLPPHFRLGRLSSDLSRPQHRPSDRVFFSARHVGRLRSRVRRAADAVFPRLRGTTLSNTTCPTNVFFKSGE